MPVQVRQHSVRRGGYVVESPGAGNDATYGIVSDSNSAADCGPIDTNMRILLESALSFVSNDDCPEHTP